MRYGVSDSRKSGTIVRADGVRGVLYLFRITVSPEHQYLYAFLLQKLDLKVSICMDYLAALVQSKVRAKRDDRLKFK